MLITLTVHNTIVMGVWCYIQNPGEGEGWELYLVLPQQELLSLQTVTLLKGAKLRMCVW